MSRTARFTGARLRPLHRLALLLVLLLGVVGSLTTLTSPPPASAATTAIALPFDMPSTATLRSSPKKVFAHWVSSLPPSLDNEPAASDYYAQNYLIPTGENGKHAAYGGYLRDRPLPRAPRTESNWRVLDMQAEVQAATAAGFDGFTVVMYSLPNTGKQDGDNVELMLQAALAADPGFKIILQPDLSAPAIRALTPAQLAAAVSRLGGYGSAYKLSDGRLVVSPFKAEINPASWWTQFMDIMRTTYARPVSLWPVFLDEAASTPSFAPISDVLSHWGGRNPLSNNAELTTADSPRGRIARIHGLGKSWMQPVSVQDERPRAGVFDEAENTQNLRNTWKIAIDGGADHVHMTTWNDLPEGSQFAPTPKHGWTFLDISSYYLAWFKTGAPPALRRDAVYLTHRTQPHAARPSYNQTLLMSVRAGTSAPRDTVEALTFLTAPARVTISVGASSYVCQASAGLDTCTVPLSSGPVSVKVVRDGLVVAGTTSPRTVTSTPYVQDLEYAGASSGREPTSGTNGVATTSTTYVQKVVTAPALADTYANQGAPSANYGTSSSLSGNGNAQAFVRFDVPQPPAGTTLAGAALRVQTLAVSNAGSVSAYDVLAAGDSWSETALTWSNKPATTGAVLGTLAGGSVVNRSYSIPLTTATVAAMRGSQRTLALVASATTVTDNLVVWSRDQTNPSARPQLVLTYAPDTVAPTAPSGLTASASGTSVSLAWTGSTDNAGVAGYEVHRGSSATFTATAATRVATVSGLSWTGAVSTAAPYYRVTAKDAGGNVSAATAAVLAGSSPSPSPSPTSPPVVQAVTPSADAAVNSMASSTNYGTSWTLTSTGSPASTSYLRFVLPSAPAGRTLTAATLQLHTTTSSGAGSAQQHTVAAAPLSWSESTLTWANRPTGSTTALGTVAAGSQPDAALSAALSVTALRPLLGTTTTVLLSSTGTDSLNVWSRENTAAGAAPRLVLTFS